MIEEIGRYRYIFVTEEMGRYRYIFGTEIGRYIWHKRKADVRAFQFPNTIRDTKETVLNCFLRLRPYIITNKP